jgi:predicted outer membrane protein
MKLILKVAALGALLVGLYACQESGQDKVKDGGKVVGETAANLYKSVKAGVEKAAKITIELDESLANRIETGKTELASSGGGRHNKLAVYMIFNKNINTNTVMKVYDSQGQEVGRSKVAVKASAGDAKIVEYEFDKRTNIDRDFRITLSKVQ